MRKPKLLLGLTLIGLLTGAAGGHVDGGGFIAASSLAGIAIGMGVLLWMIIAYHLDD